MWAVSKDLMAMKVAELKEELEARDEGGKSGNKAWLRRRLQVACRNSARASGGEQ